MASNTACLPPLNQSSSPLSGQAKRRFENISAPTEWIENYRPGGYHPVHIGDHFHGSRYKVIRKLGYGCFSTVWLAKDLKSSTYVALKIVVAETGISQNEVNILRILSQSRLQHPGRTNVMMLRDIFEHHGPNGTHLCLVFDVMGPSVESATDNLPASMISDENRSLLDRKLPFRMAKLILLQLLRGIDYMHQNGIAHRDLQPGNILFSLKDLISEDEKGLTQNLKPMNREDPDDDGEISGRVQRLDGTIDNAAPRYLALSKPLNNLVDLSPPPEVISGAQINQGQDMWNFGCLMFRFFTGCSLSSTSFYSNGEEEDRDDDHFRQFSNIPAPFPPQIRSRGRRSNLYYDSTGELLRTPLVPNLDNEPTDEKRLESVKSNSNQTREKTSNNNHHDDELPEDDASDDETHEDADILSLDAYFDKYQNVDVTDDDALVIKDWLR